MPGAGALVIATLVALGATALGDRDEPDTAAGLNADGGVVRLPMPDDDTPGDDDPTPGPPPPLEPSVGDDGAPPSRDVHCAVAGCIAWSRPFTPGATGGYPFLGQTEDLVMMRENDRIVAREHADGSVRWRVPVPGASPPRGPGPPPEPLLLGGDLVLDVGESLVRLDAADGTVRWVVEAPREVRLVELAPGARGQVLGRGTGRRARIIAWDAATGERQWDRTAHRAAVAEGSAVITRAWGTLRGLDSDGATSWERTVADATSPVAFGSAADGGDGATGVMLVDPDGVRVVEVTTGEVTRELPDARLLGRRPGTGVVLDGERLRALESSGEDRWSTPIDEIGEGCCQDVAPLGSAIEVRLHGGTSVVVDRENGRVLDRLELADGSRLGFPFGPLTVQPPTGPNEGARVVAGPERRPIAELPTEALLQLGGADRAEVAVLTTPERVVALRDP